MPDPAFNNKVLDVLFNQDSLDIDGYELSLHSDDPGDDGSNEVEGGGYERQSITFDFVTGSQTEVESQQDILFSDLPEVGIEAFGLWVLPYGYFIPVSIDESSQIQVSQGNSYFIPSGSIKISL